MFQKLASHNTDIYRLIEKGYAIAFDSNYMVIRDIPYLDSDKNLKIGAIVTKLEFIDNSKVIQQDHQIFFAGSIPHNINGEPIPNLGGGPITLALSSECNDVVVERSFSNKPKATGKFHDFFDKIESYVTIISGPAIELYEISPYTFRVNKHSLPNDIFKFHDTLTSRAEISDLSSKLNNEVVAIIGLGGTGAYLLDFLIKSPILEIKAYDIDPFHVHNAFRSPGKLTDTEFGKSKADVYRLRYENFRNGLTFKPLFIDDTCHKEFDDVTFAFVCVDKGSSRAAIFSLLNSKKIPYIDVGMGLNKKHGSLSGLLRTTYFPIDDVPQKEIVPLSDNPDDIYKTNIQISELNALNACLAVIKYKQLLGFYKKDVTFDHFFFGIENFSIIGEKHFNEN